MTKPTVGYQLNEKESSLIQTLGSEKLGDVSTASEQKWWRVMITAAFSWNVSKVIWSQVGIRELSVYAGANW